MPTAIRCRWKSNHADPEQRPVTVVGVVRDLTRARTGPAAEKFASMLSHEFRTPLSTIDGAVQRLEMTGAHHDEGTRKRYRKIQTAVDRMLAMLDEYLSPERMAASAASASPMKSTQPAAAGRRRAGASRRRTSRGARLAAMDALRPGRHAFVSRHPAG
jgi:signal transduction histidine kinase